MSVLLCPATSSLDYKDLYQLLLSQQNRLDRDCEQIVSISLEIDPIDPLVVLQNISRPEQLSCYFENRGRREAIATVGAVSQIQIEGPRRFYQAQRFINSCFTNMITMGDLNHSFAGPRFFCNFGFFDRKSQADYPFPSATIFLPRWQVACRDEKCVLVANIVINTELNLERLCDQLQTKLKAICALKSSATIQTNRHKIFNQHLSSSDSFKRAVLSCLELIHSHHLSKVVLAQALDISSHTPFNLFQSLDKLRKLYPHCYVFSTSNGKGQNFIGASPERLISIHNTQLMTDALAGSAPRGKIAAEDAELAHCLLNSEKERREHRVVIDFITQRLQRLGLSPQTLPLRLRQLSNIQHLWTPIQAKVPADVHPLEIVAELHPTPAVAGAAREIACEEIRRYETFERGLYAAPLGWVDHQGNSEFIVRIRSALIDGDRARLYAGVGIVAGSNPDQELAEIQLKLQALLKALA